MERLKKIGQWLNSIRGLVWGIKLIPSVITFVTGILEGASVSFSFVLALSVLVLTLGLINLALIAFEKIKKLFPSRISDDQSEPDVWLYDAIWRAYRGDWEKVEFIQSFERKPDDVDAEKLGSIALDDVRQFAFDGKLPVWGKKTPYDIWTRVPPEIWERHRLDWNSFLKGDVERMTIDKNLSSAKPVDWHYLKTSKDAVERIWPTKNSWMAR